MSAEEIDAYFAQLEEPKRATLEEMRRRILEVIPDAEQTISYSMPAFTIQGKVVAGLAAFKRHLAYLPHSGSTLASVGDLVDGYRQTKGSLHFALDEPLPRRLVQALVDAKLHELGLE